MNAPHHTTVKLHLATRSLREEGATEGRPPRDLVYCTPSESLQTVVDRLFAAHCSMAPVLSKDPDSTLCYIYTLFLSFYARGVLHCCVLTMQHDGNDHRFISNTYRHAGSDSNVLHIATMSGVLACLMRHFRASVSSLPLLSAPVGSLPIGTWSPEAPLVLAEAGKAQQVRVTQVVHALVTMMVTMTVHVDHDGAC